MLLTVSLPQTSRSVTKIEVIAITNNIYCSITNNVIMLQKIQPFPIGRALSLKLLAQKRGFPHLQQSGASSLLSFLSLRLRPLSLSVHCQTIQMLVLQFHGVLCLPIQTFL